MERHIPNEPGEPSDGLPPIDNVYNPTLEEVVAHFKAGTISELTDGGSVGVIGINNSPKISSEIWMGPDGDPVSSFGRKFDKGFTGWKPGELVNASFTLTTKNGHPALIVSDRYIGDIRHADTFILSDLSDDAIKDIQALGMAQINADVEVTDDGTYVVSNMFDYNAQVRRINAVQPIWDGETEPEIGEQLLLQGEVISYEPGEVDYKAASFPMTQILLPNGRIIDVEMFNGEINYEGGVMDFYHPRDFQVGDIVQLNTTYGNISNWPEHQNRPATFNAVFCRSSFLVTPSEERQATYDAHRTDIANRVANLRELEGDALLDAYAEVMNTYVDVQEKSIFSRSLMKDSERTLIAEIMKQKFIGNPDEGPVLGNQSAGTMTAISQSYGVDVYRLNRQEFYELCVGIADGNIQASPGSSGIGYPFGVLKDEYSTGDQLKVLINAVTSGLARTSGKRVVTSDQEYIDPATEAPFHERYLVDQSISMLARVEGLEPTVFLFETVKKVINTTIASPKRTVKDRFNDPTSTLLSALDSNLREAGYWGEQRNEDLSALEDPVKLDYFMSRAPELRELGVALAENNGHMDDYNAIKISETLAMIDRLASMPLHTPER